jgi:hypothetical protein
MSEQKNQSGKVFLSAFANVAAALRREAAKARVLAGGHAIENARLAEGEPVPYKAPQLK